MTSQTFQFVKATKQLSFLRLALFGPSGGGKTYTALRMATGIVRALAGKLGNGRIAVIDTERGSAAKYSDRFDFDTLLLDSKTLRSYIGAVEAAAVAGFPVLIIDSLTHGWRELQEQMDRLSRAKFGGNYWAAWSEGTPEQRRFIDALLNYPGHIIATMRSRTEWTTQTDPDGRKRPVRIGLAPEEGKGIEYEFDLLMEMNTDNIGTVIKDRTGKFQTAILDKPGEEFGQQVLAWLSEGAPPDPNERRLAFLLPLLTGAGTLSAEATMSQVLRLLEMSPWGKELPIEKVPMFQAWVAEVAANKKTGLTLAQAVDAASSHWSVDGPVEAVVVEKEEPKLETN